MRGVCVLPPALARRETLDATATTRVLGWRFRIAAVVVVAALMFGGRWALGASLGDPCSDAFLCNALPARCLLTEQGDGYCSRPCEADDACPDGWTCAELEARSDRGSPTEQTRACVRPGDDASARFVLRRR